MAGFSAQAVAADVYPPLYRDLTERPADVATFFPMAPADPAAWVTRAEVAMDQWRGDGPAGRRDRLVAALREYHHRLGTHPSQEASLQALARPDALVVVTGQQPGLFGGPLFTLYKAVGALLRAREAARLLGCPVVPVFWVASEDHDWSEVSRTQFADRRGELIRLSLAGAGDGRSAGRIPVPAEAHRLVSALSSAFPPAGEGGRRVASALAADLGARGLSLAAWFARQWHRLLGPQGLLLYDPMEPALRALAAPLLGAAAGRALQATEAIRAADAALTAAGYTPGLHVEEDHVHLFAYLDDQRVALHLEDGHVRTRDGRVRMTPQELSDRVRRQPTAFSPNVALRPIIQSHTLPVLCQLAGPGEVAYLAQLRRVFELWEQEPPIVSPRPGATIVVPDDLEAVARAGVRVEDLRRDVQDVITRAAAARAPLDLDKLFAAERAAVEERYSILAARLPALAPTLSGVVATNRNRVAYQLEYLERKVKQHLRRKERGLALAVRAAAGRLFPSGALQERHSCIYPYLLTEGESFLDEVQAGLEAGGSTFGRHWLLVREPG